MDDNPVIALFKLGERDHIIQLLNEGHVYMNPVSKFRSEDSASRSDPDEGTGYCRQANGATLSMHHEAEWRTIGTLTGPIRITDRTLEKMNIYCLHARRQSDYGSLLELNSLGFGDSYVLFLDADEFLRRLSQAVARAGHELRYAMVNYIDRHSHTGSMSVFSKFSEFSNQRELRAATVPGTGAPLSLYLGKLSDIAIMGSTSERLRLEQKPL